MAVYVDGFRALAAITDVRTGRTYTSRWSHLISDDLDPTELHAFAARLGMKREWFQPGNTLGTKDGGDRVGDHYDLTDPKRRKAIKLGAQEIDLHGMGRILETKRRKARAMTTTDEDRSGFFSAPVDMTSSDGIEMRGDRYVLPTNDGTDGKWHPHTRVTAISGVLPNTTGLGIWLADRVAWAMAQRPDLCAELASVPVDDAATIRKVRGKAEIVSAADAGANLGTATHNILARYGKGEPIDTLHRMFHPDIRAFAAKLAEYGLTVMPELIERVVRMRDYDVAGRFDYVMREADGTLVIVDVKTKGDPESVHDVATQLAIYDNADEMYDAVTGRWLPMPPVRRDYALMIHLRPGSGVCMIKKIDTRLGLWSVEIAKKAMAYAKMTHLATPYVMPGPVKPADHALDMRQAWFEPVPASQSAHLVRNGQLDPHAVAEAANAVLDEAHQRIGSTHPHGVVIPDERPPTYEPPPAPPKPVRVPAPDPATYGAPAGVVPPPAYEPQTIEPRPEAVLMTDGKDGVETEASEICDAFKSKSKAQMQAYARRYGITDLKHHKLHIAKSIAICRADRRKAGLDPEPAASEYGIDQPAAQRPRTMAETGLPPAPAQPPGQPVIDLTEQTVLSDIAKAKSVRDIAVAWQLYTEAHGTHAWRGAIEAAANAKVAEINAAPAPMTVDDLPF